MTLLFWLVSRLPLVWAQYIGDVIGALIARLPGKYGRRLQVNYRHALPDAPVGGTKAAAQAAGRMMMEMPYFWMRKNGVVPLHIEPASYYDDITASLAHGKGVIYLSPHLGAYELLGPLMAQHGKCTVLFKPPKRAFLKDWVERTRAGPNLAMAPANFKGIRMLLKALRRGECIGILPDQCPPAGEGEWATFFGRQAYTMTLVQRLQAQTGARIVLVFAERLAERGKFKIFVEALKDALPSDPQAAVALLNQHMERLIRMAPNQYLWGYNRYKRPNGVAAPSPIKVATPGR